MTPRQPNVGTVLALIGSAVVGFFGFVSLTQATLGVGTIALAILLAIYARINQAGQIAHHSQAQIDLIAKQVLKPRESPAGDFSGAGVKTAPPITTTVTPPPVEVRPAKPLPVAIKVVIGVAIVITITLAVWAALWVQAVTE